MRRIVCFLALALVGGTYLGYLFSDAAILFGSAFLILSLLKLLFSRRRTDILYPIASVILICASLMILCRGDVTQKALYPYLDEYVDVVAEVTKRPEKEENKVTFYAKITELSFLDETISPMETVRLTCREKAEDLDFGDVITARVRLNLPKEETNEGGFDYNLYLKTKGVFFSGYVDSDSLNIIGKKEFGILDHIQKLNYKMCDITDRTLTEDTAPIMKGILFGDKSTMSDDMRTKFSRSGLAHIVAVSGMHISTLLTILFMLYRVFGLKSFRMGILSVCVVVFYVLLSGASISSVRAGIMAVVTIGAECTFRKVDSYTSLALTVTGILLFEPFAAFDVGFMLSCGAVFGILLYVKPLEMCLLKLLHLADYDEKKYKHFLRKVISLLSTSISAQFFTLPIILFFFQETSLWGIISNLIVVPMLPLIMFFGLLMGFLGLVFEPLALYPAGASYLPLLLVKHTADFFGSLDSGRIIYGVMTPMFVSCYAIMLYLIFSLLHKKFIKQSLLLSVFNITLLFLIGSCVQSLNADIAKVCFINVGQGDSCCISLPEDTDILIDGGGTAAYQDYYDIGAKVVRPYLLKQGVTDIEYMIASHGHEDHVLGLVSILREMPVDRLIVPRGFGTTDAAKFLLSAAKQKFVPVTEVCAGETISLGETASIEVLMPDREWAEGLTEEEENMRSLVLRFTYGENSFLFTGDLGEEAEKRLVDAHNGGLSADVLKLAHHGAANSSSEEFIDAANPLYAYIPVGENNFGHPHPDILERLISAGTSIYRADRDKDVVFVMDLKHIVSIR
ncbi:MAG: DNA internalization-related competence protein ComEC/Rec2 [Clostridia bacterium]|nr:DNA internalization-related competence protein ComEC/Rec2 [Clostridia bacterium]